MSGEEPEDTFVSKEQRRAVRSLFASLPESYEDQFAALKELRRVFHEEMAAAFQPLLRQQAQRQPTDEFEDRTRLVAVIQGDLDSLGLSLADPLSKRPATLTIDLTAYVPGKRIPFQLFVRDDAGRIRITDASMELPTLHVRDAAPLPLQVRLPWLRREPRSGPSR